MIAVKRIDSRYATALLQLATERGIAKEVYDNMLELRILTFENVEFKKFLANPTIRQSQKAEILKNLFKDVFHQLTLDFILLITKKARAWNIMNIATAYVRKYRVENHFKTVTVYTEEKLLDGQKQNLEVALSQQMPGETIELRCHTWPGLIGGMALRYDDYLYNASISRQLEDIRLKIKSTPLSFVINS